MVSIVFEIIAVIGGIFLIIFGINVFEKQLKDRKSHKRLVGILLVLFGILLIVISPMLVTRL